jgi:anti-sigma regulatory factor (Ser/Thr protein kinase)
VNGVVTHIERQFARRIEALPELVAFADAALEGAPMQAAQRHALDFVLEELFTNMVKYAPGGAPTIAIRIARLPEGAEVSLLDADVDCFDVTRAPPAAVLRPLAQREPGGLGIHLLRRLVDQLDYRYDPQRREGLTRFRVAFARNGQGAPC